MAIIVFSSSEKKETGQTLTTAALATYMSIEHNQKMLIVSTDFNDGTLEDCFWPQKKEEIIVPTYAKIIIKDKNYYNEIKRSIWNMKK